MNLWLAIPTFAAAASWIVVVVWYSVRAKWWKTFIGQNTWAISFIIMLALIRLSIIHLTLSSSVRADVGSTVFGFLIYFGLAYVGIQRVYLIEESQRKAMIVQNYHEALKSSKNDKL